MDIILTLIIAFCFSIFMIGFFFNSLIITITLVEPLLETVKGYWDIFLYLLKEMFHSVTYRVRLFYANIRYFFN